MIRAAVFDLGNTLVAYYEKPEFAAILADGIRRARACVARELGVTMPDEVIEQRVADENHEATDFRVRPLAGRLARVFGLSANALCPRIADALCRAWLEPTFEIGRPYNDSLDTLAELRSRGLTTGLVSNTPWGSPGGMWREELARLGLMPLLDAVVFCTDVGWRKPDPRPFEACVDRLGVRPHEALFVGDHPRWDIEGAAAAGLRPVLIDRAGSDADAIVDLGALVALIEAESRSSP